MKEDREFKIVVTRRQFLTSGGAALAAYAMGCKGQTQSSPANGAMVLIPAGVFKKGTELPETQELAERYGYHPSWLSGETPAQEINLRAYWIDKFPVTNRQFSVFCKATGFPPRPHWAALEAPDGILDHPVTYVTRADAKAYAKWAGKRLPSEAEWEKAARGTKGLTFPWGDQFEPSACNWNASDEGTGGPIPTGLEMADLRFDPIATAANRRTTPVTQYAGGASSYGVMDMIGNVAEWCADPPHTVAFIKGGCWLTHEVINLRAAARNMSGNDSNAGPFYGFRCAKDA